MSACERYEADLSALLDGELDSAREEELRAHMDVCEDCRTLYETFSLLHEDAQEPPADLTARIMDAVRSEAPDNIVPMPKKKNRWVPWLAAAACFVVIVGAVTLPRLSAQKNTGAADAASRAIPMSVPESEDQTDALNSTGGDTTRDESVEAAPLTVTDPEQIAAVRSLLRDPAAAEDWQAADPPLLLLQESERTTPTSIYLDGDDVYYTDDGEAYFRCADAAEGVIEYLAQQ